MPPFTPRGLDEKLKYDQLEAEREATENAREAIGIITKGEAIRDSHGQTFITSAEALHYVTHYGASDFDNVVTTGLVYGETILRHARGEAGWTDDTVLGDMSDALRNRVVGLTSTRATAEGETFDPTKAGIEERPRFFTAASLAVAQNAAFRGMRQFVKGIDLKKLADDMSKNMDVKERANWLAGRERLLMGLGALGSFATRVTIEQPRLLAPALLTGGILGGAVEGGRRLLDQWHQVRAKSEGARISQRKAVLNRVIAALDIQKGKPESLPKLTTVMANVLKDETERSTPVSEAVKTALDDRFELLIGGVQASPEDPAAKPKDTDPSLVRRLLSHPRRWLGAVAVGAMTITAGAAVGEMVHNDHPAAVVGTPGKTGPTVVTPPSTTPQQGTTEECRILGATSTTVVINGQQTSCP